VILPVCRRERAARPRRCARRPIVRRVGALMLDTNHEWTVARRYMGLESLARITDTPNQMLSTVAA